MIINNPIHYLALIIIRIKKISVKRFIILIEIVASEINKGEFENINTYSMIKHIKFMVFCYLFPPFHNMRFQNLNIFAPKYKTSLIYRLSLFNVFFLLYYELFLYIC